MIIACSGETPDTADTGAVATTSDTDTDTDTDSDTDSDTDTDADTDADTDSDTNTIYTGGLVTTTVCFNTTPPMCPTAAEAAYELVGQVTCNTSPASRITGVSISVDPRDVYGSGTGAPQLDTGSATCCYVVDAVYLDYDC